MNSRDQATGTRWAFWLGALAVAACGAAAGLEAGAAKVDITPPPGAPLNGYLERLGRGAIDVHDPVWSRCLYLNDGDTAVFLCAVDLCLVNPELRARVLDLAGRITAAGKPVVPREHVILTATHTHNAQGGMIEPLVFRLVSGPYTPEVLEQTATRIAQSMREAYERRQRAAIGFGTGATESISKNRRIDEGPIDEQFGVMRVDNADGTPIAAAACLAAHPNTVRGADLYTVSADYPGLFCAMIEEMLGGEAMGLFLQGACADQRCAIYRGREGWQRTETVAELLAQRTRDAVREIRCGEAALGVGYVEPALPRTLAADYLPDATVVQTLEIAVETGPPDADTGEVPRDTMALAFLPGKPGVEIGLELRRQAVERGYANLFAVGLANDFVGCFVTPQRFPERTPESALTFYGPRTEAWLDHHVGELLTLGAPGYSLVTQRGFAPGTPALEEHGGALVMRLEGTPYEIGRQRGAAMRADLRRAFEEHVRAPVEAGRLIPESGFWQRAPGFLDLTPLALPTLAAGMRHRLARVPAHVLEEIEGMADGAEMSFDAMWLVHNLTLLDATQDAEDLHYMPFCTMVAVVGARAGADDAIVGRNLDWTAPDRPVAAIVTPSQGHRFMAFGFPWTAGAFTGMNDTGLVVCAERAERLGAPSLDAPPIELVLRGALQYASTCDDVAGCLEEAGPLRGYRVLAATPDDVQGGSVARVFELGDSMTVRKPEDGLLLGGDPESADIDKAAKARYRRLLALLTDERIVAPVEIEQALHDREPGLSGRACILNEDNVYCAVFEPKHDRARVAFSDGKGRLGAPVELRFEPREERSATDE